MIFKTTKCRICKKRDKKANLTMESSNYCYDGLVEVWYHSSCLTDAICDSKNHTWEAIGDALYIDSLRQKRLEAEEGRTVRLRYARKRLCHKKGGAHHAGQGS